MAAFPDVAGGAINVRRLSFPRGGTLVFVGVYFDIGRWIWLAQPQRVILTYNTPDPDKLAQHVRLIRRACRFMPEIVFCSKDLADSVPFDGIVEPSLVDLDRFAQRTSSRSNTFRVGRLSRDAPEKHHPADMQMYRDLAAAGCEIDVLGATSQMQADAVGSAGLQMRPIGTMDASAFLRNLDCFLYRTSPTWAEPWGRVIIEAMASGLPVVTDRRSGASKVIEHGRNGLLFDSTEEAIAQVLQLKEQRGYAEALGAAARGTAESILGSSVRRQIQDFYLSPG